MKYCKGVCATPEPYWKYCPVCGKPMDPHLMDVLGKVIEKESAKYGELCHTCGQILYPHYDPDQMTGITVHSGICPRCGREDTMIPVSDWQYASGDKLKWD